MREVLMDAPGAGDWIMQRVGGTFNPLTNHTFSSHRDGNLLGGIVTSDYFGNSMSVHMAGEDKYWFTRDLAWLVFDYCFRHCKCHKILTGVRSTNHQAINIDLRGGWQIETVIRDVFEPGVHMVVLYMTPSGCKWLNNYQPRFKVFPKVEVA